MSKIYTYNNNGSNQWTLVVGTRQPQKDCCCLKCPTVLNLEQIESRWPAISSITYSEFISEVRSKLEYCCGLDNSESIVSTSSSTSSSSRSGSESSSSTSSENDYYCKYTVDWSLDCLTGVLTNEIIEVDCDKSGYGTVVIGDCDTSSSSSSYGYSMSSASSQSESSLSSESTQSESTASTQSESSTSSSSSTQSDSSASDSIDRYCQYYGYLYVNCGTSELLYVELWGGFEGTCGVCNDYTEGCWELEDFVCTPDYDHVVGGDVAWPNNMEYIGDGILKINSQFMMLSGCDCGGYGPTSRCLKDKTWTGEEWYSALPTWYDRSSIEAKINWFTSQECIGCCPPISTSSLSSESTESSQTPESMSSLSTSSSSTSLSSSSSNSSSTSSTSTSSSSSSSGIYSRKLRTIFYLTYKCNPDDKSYESSSSSE